MNGLSMRDSNYLFLMSLTNFHITLINSNQAISQDHLR